MKMATVRPYAPAAAAMLVLAGCGSTPPRGPEQSRHATQVFVGNCITVRGLKESAIGASILTSVIGQGLTRIGTTLTGNDATRFNVLGLCKRPGQKGGRPAVEIKAFLDEATAGDYNHLLATCQRWFDCY